MFVPQDDEGQSWVYSLNNIVWEDWEMGQPHHRMKMMTQVGVLDRSRSQVMVTVEMKGGKSMIDP